MSQKCPYDPSMLIGVPLGMFHCPECGEMVVAGMAHPDYSLIEEPPTNHLQRTILLAQVKWHNFWFGLSQRFYGKNR